MSEYLLGIDNGSTMTKAALYALDGRELAVAARKVATTPQADNASVGVRLAFYTLRMAGGLVDSRYAAPAANQLPRRRLSGIIHERRRVGRACCFIGGTSVACGRSIPPTVCEQRTTQLASPTTNVRDLGPPW